MPSTDPAIRGLVASIAAHERWARTRDRSTNPESGGLLPEADRARCADSARKALERRVVLKSVQARRARARAEQLEAEVAEALTTQPGR